MLYNWAWLGEVHLLSAIFSALKPQLIFATAVLTYFPLAFFPMKIFESHLNLKKEDPETYNLLGRMSNSSHWDLSANAMTPSGMQITENPYFLTGSQAKALIERNFGYESLQELPRREEDAPPGSYYTQPLSLQYFSDGREREEVEFFVSESGPVREGISLIASVEHFWQGERTGKSYFDLGEFDETLQPLLVVSRIKQYAEYAISTYSKTGNWCHCPSSSRIDYVDEKFNSIPQSSEAQ